MSDPCSLLLEEPESLAMRDPNWMALLGSLAAVWHPRIAATSLNTRFSPIPRGRDRSTYMTNIIQYCQKQICKVSTSTVH